MLTVPTHEDFASLSSQVAEIQSLLKDLLIASKKTITYSVADIARIEGVSKSYLYGKGAYLLPNFGVSQYPGPTRWDFDTYLKWRAQPVDLRERTFKELSKRNRLSRANA